MTSVSYKYLTILAAISSAGYRTACNKLPQKIPLTIYQPVLACDTRYDGGQRKRREVLEEWIMNMASHLHYFTVIQCTEYVQWYYATYVIDLITNLVDYRHSVPRNTTQDRGRKGVTKNSGWQRVCMLIKKTTPYSGKILLEVGCKVIQWGRKSRLLLNRLLGGLFLLCTESTEYFQKKEKERRDNPRNKIAGERTNPVRET